jgi:hypothetical protein
MDGSKSAVSMQGSLLVGSVLEHHGVKGMKWGVHHQRELELHSRVANGTGSALDKAAVLSRMSAIDLAKNKGSVVSFAKKKAEKLQAQKERVQSGKATLRDKIELASSYSAEDALRSATNKPRAEHSAMTVEDVLSHHGIKGMKWGVRSASSKAEEHASPDHVTVEAAKAKAASGGVKALSNVELQTIVTRMNLEQQHRNL